MAVYESLVLTGTDWINLAHANVSGFVLHSRHPDGTDQYPWLIPLPADVGDYSPTTDYELDATNGRVRRRVGSQIPAAVLGGSLAPYMVWAEYTHADAPFVPPVSKDLPRFSAKVAAGMHLDVILFGDSISTAAECDRYGVLAESLAPQEGTPGTDPAFADPHPYYYKFLNGIATRWGCTYSLENKAVGGATTSALSSLTSAVNRRVDLVIIAYGMNDQGSGSFGTNIRNAISAIRANYPTTEFMLVGSCAGAPGWDNVSGQRTTLATIASDTEGVFFSDTLTRWEAYRARKDYHSLLRNDINHPSSFGHLIYTEPMAAIEPAAAADLFDGTAYTAGADLFDGTAYTEVVITPRTTTPPQLHHVYFFDAGDTMRAVASNGGEGMLIVSDLHTEDTAGTNTYELTLTDHPDIAHVTAEGQLMFRDLDGLPRLMRIKTVATKHDSGGVTHTVTAYDAAYELGGIITRKPSWSGKTVAQVVADLLNGTRWSVVAEATAVRDFSLDYGSVWEGVRKACEAYGVEFYTTCEVSGRKLTNRTINIVLQRGTDRGMRFMWGRDIKSLEAKRSSLDTATAILPLGASDSDGAYVTIANVTASDKPATQDWIGDEEARAIYGPVQSDGTRAHMTRVVSFPDIRDEHELLEAARTELARVKAAVLSVDVDAVLLDALGYDFLAVRVGDTVGVTDPATGTATSIRVPEVRRSYTNKTGGGL